MELLHPVVIAAVVTGMTSVLVAMIMRKKRDKQPISVESSPNTTVVAGKNIHIDNRTGGDETHKHAVSEKYNEVGRAKVQQWGREYSSRASWNWYLLSQALDDYSTSIRWNEANPHPWINRAYVYHLAGNRGTADRCLKTAKRMATPGRHYSSVARAVQRGEYLTGGKVHTPKVPSWFG